MNSIYLAGSSRDAEIIEEEAQLLQERGHRVISTWHHDAPHFDQMSKSLLWEICTQQVAAADACVVYPPYGDKPLRGAIFEAGFAVALRKKLIIVMPKLHVGDWIHYGQAVHVESTEEASKFLGK